MIPGRGISAAVAALLLASGGIIIALCVAPAAHAQPAPQQGAAAECEAALQVAVLPAPLEPWKGAPLRVIVTAEKPLDGELSLIGPDGAVAAKSRDREGGPPYYWYAEVATPAVGAWHATLALDHETDGCGSVTREVTVAAHKPAGPRATAASVWPLRNNWNRANEDLFSAWIAKLFDAPLSAEPSWKVWFEVLRDPSRNMLFDYLGLDEEKSIKSLRPDCADFVYFLRAYFSFKMGLPFAYSNCSRGMAGSPPKCYQWFDILHPEITRPAPPPERTVAAADPEPAPEPTASTTPGLLRIFSPTPPPRANPAPAKPAPASRRAAPSLTRLPLAPRFGEYLRIVGDVVHTGSVRVSANDDNTDFYMVPLSQDALRPGTVYADPYGHVLMLVKRVPQTAERAGVFLAVDAEPDGTVTRKRFWRGNFLFVHQPSLGSPGFKRFRPIVREKSGALHRLTNAEIAKNPDYGNVSLEQTKLGEQDFYDKMDAVMSPSPLNPAEAMDEAIAALDEQVKTRVVAVENGRKYQIKARGDVTMPAGPSIFETTGAWEDYSTPARDFRLLVAIDVVTGYPDRVEHHPERFAIPAGESPAEAKTKLQAKLAAELAAHKFTYTRSDGSTWTLSLKDVVDREALLEMGYNPNDCVELRWGAKPGSDEASPCKRHAPAAQRAKMTDYRTWFRERHWPHA